MSLTSLTWFAAVGDVMADIPGLARVYGVKGAATDPKVVPMADEVVVGPIGVLGYGGAEIIPGSWERQTHTLNAAIWIPYQAGGIGKAYDQSIGFIDGVMDTFPPRSKAGAPHPELASVLVTGFEPVEARVWGELQAQRTFLVLPFSISVVRNRAAQYQAA